MATPARIINESTSLLLASQGQTLYYLSTTTTPGQLVTVTDATGIVTPSQPITISTVGGAQLVGGASRVQINQRFGYVTLHSDMLTADLWKVVNTTSFSNPTSTATLKGVTARTLTTRTAAVGDMASTTQLTARVGTSFSSCQGAGVLITSSLYTANLGTYISSTSLGARAVFDDSALLYDSVFVGGRFQVRGTLSTGTDFFVASNTSSKLGTISIGGNLTTMSNIRNQRAVQTVASFASTYSTATFGANASLLSSLIIGGSLQAGAASTPLFRTNTFAASSSIQFSATAQPRYWKYTANEIVFEGLPAIIPSISTNFVANSIDTFTPRVFLSSLSTATTVSSILLSSAQIQNPNGSLTISSIASRTILTLQNLFTRSIEASAQVTAHQIQMNRTGGSGFFAFPVPPNDPQPFGVFVGQTNWEISSPTANLSTPHHGLSSQYLTASFVAASTVRALSNTITNFAASDLTVTRAITFSNASSFVATSTFIQNTGGRILNPTTVATHMAQTSTISTQSISSSSGTAGSLQISAPSTVQMTRANISTAVANACTTSSLTLTSATLGAPFTYSTITPAATWLLPSTFQLQTPPFQFTEGEGTYFNKVFFTAAQDCVAYYSIVDPRSQTPATLSTLHVNTVAGTGTAGATGQAIGNIYGSPVMDSTFATYFGDNFGIWRLRRLGPNGLLSTMGGRSRFYYGDNGPAIDAVLGPKTYVALNSTDSVIVTDVSNVRIRRAFFDGTFNTIAGNGIEGYTGDGGLALAATLYNPATTTTDSSGTVYIADASNNVIRAIVNSTMTTYAGNGISGGSGDGGPALAASFSEPFGVAVDLSNNLYIADTNNHVVRKVDPATSTVTLIAGIYIAGFSGDGGPATAAQLNAPKGVAVDVSSNIYILDAGNVRVRRIDGITGDITTVAGDGTNGYAGDNGPATTAVLNQPLGITTDSQNNLYIADTGNHIVRQILAGTGFIYRFAGIANTPGFSGDGSFATFARLNTPTTVACDPVSQKLYIADEANFRVRVVDIPTNVINTAVGNGSPATGGDNVPASEAVFGSIFGLARDSQQNLYLADGYGQRIRRIDPSTFIITTVGGSGVAGFNGDGGSALTAQLSTPVSLFIDNGNRIFFTDSENHRVRRIDPVTGLITTVAGTGSPGYNGDSINATTAQLSYPRALAGDAAGNLYIGDTSNFRIRRVSPAGIITTVAGTGFAGTVSPGLPAIVTSIETVTGVAVDTSTNLYFTDLGTSAVWKVPAATGIVEPFTATGPGYLNDAAPISTAVFRYPSAISFDACGNFVIADRANYRLRRTYSYGPPRLPNYLNLDFRYTNYQNTNGNSYIALNGNLLATFDAASLSDFTYAITDSNILNYPLQSSNPVLGDQTPWLEIGQVNSTGYIQLEGLAWVNQTPGQGLQSNFVNSDAGIIVNRGILRFPNRVNAITIDNKFNDVSTRSVSYTGSLFASSDPRLKENICPANHAICVSSFTALPLKRYAYKAGALPIKDRHRLGYLTTDIAAVFPKSVVPNKNSDLPLSSFNTVDYTQLKFAHLATTQHLLKEVDRLEALVSTLQARRGTRPTQRTFFS